MTEIDPSVSFPKLLKDTELLEGITYRVLAGTEFKLTHCLGLSSFKNGLFGTLQDSDNGGVITPDNYVSKHFIPQPDTLVRVVSPPEESLRCDACINSGGACVTIGPHNSSEIYHLQSLASRDSMKYVCPVDLIPLGSKVRTLTTIYADKQPSGKNETVIKYALRDDVDFEFGVKEGAYTLMGSDDNLYYKGKYFILPEVEILEIIEIPAASAVWATCWEEGQHNPGQNKFKETILRVLSCFIS